jgi:hypothetical protein
MQDQFGGATNFFRAVRDMQDLYGGIARQFQTVKAVQASKGMYADIGEQVRRLTATKDQLGGIAGQVKAVTEAQAVKGYYIDIGERYEGVAKMLADLTLNVGATASIYTAQTKMAPAFEGLRSLAASSTLLGAPRVLDATRLYGTLALPPLARGRVERHEREERVYHAVQAFA